MSPGTATGPIRPSSGIAGAIRLQRSPQDHSHSPRLKTDCSPCQRPESAPSCRFRRRHSLAVLRARFALRLDRWELPDTPEEVLVLFAGAGIGGTGLHQDGPVSRRPALSARAGPGDDHPGDDPGGSILLLVAFVSEFTGEGIVPRSVPLIYWALTLATISIVGSRSPPSRSSGPLRETHQGHRRGHIWGGGSWFPTGDVAAKQSFRYGLPRLQCRPAWARVLGIRVYNPSILASRDFGVKKSSPCPRSARAGARKSSPTPARRA